MKHPCVWLALASVVAATTATRTLADSQSLVNIPGTWQLEATQTRPAWTTVLRLDGDRLIGAVSACSGGPTEITDGQVNGRTITFRCSSRDGDRLVTFVGEISGDRISFVWEKETLVDGQPFEDDVKVGALPPPRFAAIRVPAFAAPVTTIAENARKAPSVSFSRLLQPDREPQNWLTYSGSLSATRHSRLAQITASNVKDLELAWMWQARSREGPACPSCPRMQAAWPVMEATPLVVDGIMYTVQPPNDVVALDASTGRVIWVMPYTPAGGARAPNGNGRLNRGLAVLGDTLFLGTLDAQLRAIDAYSGKLLWNASVAKDAECPTCFIITHAPLALDGKVLVGLGGSEYQIRGAIVAFDANTGNELWRFETIPKPGNPGSETWAGESWKIGGGGVWNTGAYDPDLGLTYWGIGNPFPVYDGSSRSGDNLYTNSVVALDVNTGMLKWHYQFTPHDTMDWDAAQVPVLTDLEIDGRVRKVVLFANRNGLMYVLDRATGECLIARPFVEVNWMKGLDDKRRPIRVPLETGVRMRPGTGATNWYPPSFSPGTGLFYVAASERAAGTRGNDPAAPSYGAVRALDPRTGERQWEFRMNDAVFTAGVLSTGSDLLFTGTSGDTASEPAAARLVDRYVYALDARTGAVLWKMALTGPIYGAPISYTAAGRQYVAVAGGNALFAFALRN